MRKLFLLIAIIAIVFACNNANTSKEVDTQAVDSVNNTSCCKDLVKVDSLLANIDSFVDKELTVCGKCTHICQHHGDKIFVANPDNDSLVIICKKTAEMENFSNDLQDKFVKVKGTLKAVKQEGEVEVHHDVKVNYYIEVKEVNVCSCDHKKDHKCCKGTEHKCCKNKEHKCDGKHEHSAN